MTHREKVAYFYEELKERDLSRFTSAPPIFRLLWALGVDIPPPFFVGFLPLAILMGAPWGSLMALVMWLRYRNGGVILPFVVGGFLFGVIVAALFRRTAAPLKLGSWKDYGISKRSHHAYEPTRS